MKKRVRLILSVKMELVPYDLTATEIDVLASLIEALPEGLPTDEISRRTGRLYSRVSSDLNSLKRRGIVTSKSVGRKEYYSIREEHLSMACAICAAKLTAEAIDKEVMKIKSNSSLTEEQKRVAEESFIESVKKELPHHISQVIRNIVNDIKSGKLKK